jgi:hypothetical protein
LRFGSSLFFFFVIVIVVDFDVCLQRDRKRQEVS